MATTIQLIEALAHILWPVLGFTVLFLFRRELSDLLRRIKKGKMLGQEIELADSLKELHQSAEAVKEAAESIPALSQSDEKADHKTDDIVQTVLREASKSPRAALLMLSNYIEATARRALAKVGLLKGRDQISATDAVSELHRQYGGLPGDVIGSLRLFSDVRNRIIHAGSATNEDIISALDSGITILRTLQALPSEINIVGQPGVDIYSDELCKQLIPDAKGVMLESSGPGGVKKFSRIFPTTRTHFVKGQRVAWEWNLGRGWGPTWYIDPVTGQRLLAWHQSAEFVGRPLAAI